MIRYIFWTAMNEIDLQVASLRLGTRDSERVLVDVDADYRADKGRESERDRSSTAPDIEQPVGVRETHFFRRRGKELWQIWFTIPPILAFDTMTQETPRHMVGHDDEIGCKTALCGAATIAQPARSVNFALTPVVLPVSGHIRTSKLPRHQRRVL